MDKSFSPTKPGQICKIVNPIDINMAEDVFIVTEDPLQFLENEEILVSSLKALQRNIKNPQLTPKIAIYKNELLVVADNLEAYISLWNKPKP